MKSIRYLVPMLLASLVAGDVVIKRTPTSAASAVRPPLESYAELVYRFQITKVSIVRGANALDSL